MPPKINKVDSCRMKSVLKSREKSLQNSSAHACTYNLIHFEYYEK